MSHAPTVDELLTREIGLDPAAIGDVAIDLALRSRMKALGVSSEESYLSRLALGPAERHALVEEVVVGETWFFREKAAFALLVAFARRRRMESPARPLRILSAPCATGEEPYSAAMALLDAQLPESAFEIDAVDVSAHALAAAEAGVYGPRSSRDAPVPLHHLRETAAGRSMVSPRVRSRVRFLRGNLVDPLFLAGTAPYDAVFCRNVLIYMTKGARRTVLDHLVRLVAPGGILFMGHAEAVNLMDPRWRPSDGPPEAFAFVRAAESAA
ncbi:MAG: hypothetical protein JNK60_12165 [Acidobacteria bacterium]|nr:hypothetical protein [Acidobacteriota bacterium]